MKMLRSKKALSPVVASIILIAVTVAVSIAVAAWMGALTFTFTKTEEITISSSILWGTGNANLTITNTGPASATITGAKVDAKTADWHDPNGTSNPSGGYTLSKGDTKVFMIDNPSGNWTLGTKYTFTIVTASGHTYEVVGTATP
jgi:flagellin-like protein